MKSCKACAIRVRVHMKFKSDTLAEKWPAHVNHNLIENIL